MEIAESSRIFYRKLRLGGYELTREFMVKTDVRPSARVSIPHASLDVEGVLRLEPGFQSDGATGACDTKDFMRGAFAHDAICDMHQQEREMPGDWNPKALSLLNRLCREDGMSAFRRWRVRVAVREGCKARPRDLNAYMIEWVAP
jgi:hypothetical protein